MKIPKRLKPLVEEGLVDEVLLQLTSGKEAEVFVVRCGAEIRCAKVYKEADKRSFRQIWSLYQAGALKPSAALTGRVASSDRPADGHGVMREIDEVKKEEAARQRYLQAMKQ